MPFELACQYVKWRVLALTAKSQREWLNALWQAERVHFKWRISRYTRVV